ncbi:hypothetical protein A0H81_01952 [Grifola frondosa]|uniref:Uncharacterized protein n=1 Tax=Grifola frondosa TaxID=5627 RepID=A0A1C7MKS4_GRIFR|nr:hypothetical protein A0H81_01952 [Grifola frondosa]
MEATNKKASTELEYEMPVIRQSDSQTGLTLPSPDSVSLEASSTFQGEPQEGANVQELPAVDKGVGAWMFCICGFFVEMMVWGFGFR